MLMEVGFSKKSHEINTDLFKYWLILEVQWLQMKYSGGMGDILSRSLNCHVLLSDWIWDHNIIPTKL